MQPALPFLFAFALGCGTEAAAPFLTASTADAPPAAPQTESTPVKTAHPVQSEPFPPIQIDPIERERPVDFDGALALFTEIRRTFDYSNQPDVIRAPAQRDVAYEFVKAMRFLEVQRAADVDFLKSFTGADLYPNDPRSAQNVENQRTNVLGRLEDYLPGEMKHKIDASRMQIAGQVDGRLAVIEMGADLDMSDQNLVRNRLSNELLNRSREEAIVVACDHADLMVLFDSAMEIESNWSAKREELHGTIARYRANLEAAADAIRPPADIGDLELRSIAADVLGRKTYGLPESVRLIVNAPVRSESSTEYTLDWDEATITKARRQWKEFQVATIEKEGDRFGLWYNTILYYTEGPTTVIKDKWLLGPRHRSATIAEANIGG